MPCSKTLSKVIRSRVPDNLDYGELKTHMRHIFIHTHKGEHSNSHADHQRHRNRERRWSQVNMTDAYQVGDAYQDWNDRGEDGCLPSGGGGKAGRAQCARLRRRVDKERPTPSRLTASSRPVDSGVPMRLGLVCEAVLGRTDRGATSPVLPRGRPALGGA